MLDKKSKVILVVILIVILMVTFGSHFFNFWQAGDLWQYTGSRINRGGDLFGYFSFMEQARQGAWSFFNLYSILPQQPYFVHPLWLVLGKLGAWTGFSNLAIYLLAQALFIVIFVYLWRVFLGKILTSKIVNYVFVLSLVIGGGLFSGAWFYEASNFLILFYSPLFILALSCFLAVLWLALKLIEKKFDWRISLGAGSLSLFLFLNHFYDVVPLVLVLAGLFIFLILNKRELKSYFFFFLIIGMFLLPGAIYYGWIFFTIPGLAEWGSFLQYMRSEPFIFYFVAYGL
ncbi:MAG: hypothetical protein NTV81_04515, partial [Candidatus Komeilibacteria bacterium]|nr:hypothetical protein [Candidatus Komeilibacteria bacterium]